VGTSRSILCALQNSELCWRSPGNEWSGVDRWMASEQFVINMLLRFFREFQGVIDPYSCVHCGRSQYETLGED